MSRLVLYLLGPPRVELDGDEVHVPRRKAVALLAYLAVTGRPHSRDSLAALLWPEYDQSSARADLRRTLSVLNSTLGGDWLTADGETLGLNSEAGLCAFSLQLQAACGSLDSLGRTVYHGAYPDGTAIRFESFTLWALDR